MKKIFTLLLCSALFAGSCWGKTLELGTGSGSTSATSQVMPVKLGSMAWCSLSQQIYYASELIAAGATSKGKITTISFKYSYSSTLYEPVPYTRKWEIYMKNVTNSSLSSYLDKGTKVYDSLITTPATDAWYTAIPLKTAFEWDGKSNILVTIYDKSGEQASNRTIKHILYKDDDVNTRCLYQNASVSSYDIANITSITGFSTTKYANQIQFGFDAISGPTYDALTDVNVSDISSSSAKITWTKNDSAKVKLQYVKHGQTDTTTVNDINAAFYVINSLSAETQYDYKAFAVYSTGISSAVAGSFTTTEASSHSHDGVDFIKWDATDALPTSAGNYFLTNNVSVSSWTIPSGDTKICLNGNTITFSSGYITIGSGKNLSIFDCKGTGAITANQTFNPAIKVSNGGTLSLLGGSISNTASSSEAFAVKLETGTFNIKGNVKMSTSASAANIRLANSSSVITLVDAITNTTKLSVNKAANSNITSGWSTQMGSADPADFFLSKNSDAPAVVLVSGEAQLGVPSVTISETGSNSIENNKLTDVTLVRTFKKGILNTIALPFALPDAKLQAAFGEDYELYKLSSSSLSSGVLELYFEQITALEGGKPYLLRINGDDDITNPSFSSVTLTTAHPRISTTAVDMIPVISESEITGASYNMYLNAAGELNWSTTTSSFKGMRAYFQVKGEMPSNVSVRRIVLGTNATTGLMQNAECTMQNDKVMINGQLFIIKNGVKYNAQGQIVK